MFYEQEKKVFRCGKCLKIPLLGLIYENNDLYVEYYCLNKHEKEYYNKLQYDIFKNTFQEIFTKKKCECGKQFDEKPFYYCTNCQEKQFYCDTNSRIHKRIDHILIPLEKFDIYCDCHHDEFISFCKEDKINLCIKEKKKHINHEKEDIIRLNIDDVKNYEKKIEQLKNKLGEFKIYLNKFEEDIQMNEESIKKNKIRYINNVEKEIDFLETILNNYKMKTKQNNLNYQIIQNVKNILKFKNNFNFPMIDYEDDTIFDVQCELEKFYEDFDKNSPIEFSPLTH